MKRRIIHYTKEDSDITNIKRDTIVIDENYKYIKKNILYKICQFIVYKIFVRPFAFIYMKIKFNHKCINKKCLKNYRKKGYFVYGNHTLMAGDAFIPNVINFPTNTKIIVHPDNISIKGTKTIIEMCGALPIPSTLSASRNFLNAIEYYIKKGNVIQIYPEAHIWPYYTNIRKFTSTSFKYPIKLKAPTFVITNTFHKRKFLKTPKIITYIDGPFFPNESLNSKEMEEDLCNTIYSIMLERSKLNTYEYFTYIKENKND